MVAKKKGLPGSPRLKEVRGRGEVGGATELSRDILPHPSVLLPLSLCRDHKKQAGKQHRLDGLQWQEEALPRAALHLFQIMT
jgi:hypothetical protein